MKSLNHHEYVSIGSQSASRRIILLHGWGANAYDLLPLGKELIKDFNNDFEIIAIQAPNLSANSNGREWYKLFPADWDQASIAVDQLIYTLKGFGKDKIPLKKTVLLGFSQGAAMSIDAGFKLDLGLIISCSGYSHPKWNPTSNCPVLISHGKNDNIVPFSSSQKIYQKLKSQLTAFCKMYEFDGEHEIDFNFIKVMQSKINQFL